MSAEELPLNPHEGSTYLREILDNWQALLETLNFGTLLGNCPGKSSLFSREIFPLKTLPSKYKIHSVSQQSIC